MSLIYIFFFFGLVPSAFIKSQKTKLPNGEEIIVAIDPISGLTTITTTDQVIGEKTVEVEYPNGTSYEVKLDPDSTVAPSDVAQQALAMKALEHKSNPEIYTDALKTEDETSLEVLDAIVAA